MAIYYVRPDGNDSNTGTGSGTNQAWQTLQKALGATSGLVGGDIVYVAPGRYVELVTVGITSPSSQVRIVGDPNVTQFSGLSAGVVRHTNMTAGGVNIGREMLIVTSKNNLSFENIYFEQNNNSGSGTDRIVFITCQGWQFKKCVFDDISTDNNHRMLACTATTSTPFNGVIDSCIFVGGARQLLLGGQNVADTTVIKNCIFSGAIQAGCLTGNLQFAMYNCSFLDMNGSPISADPAGSIAQTIKNCLFYRVSSPYWSTNNGVSYTYNRYIASGAPINITVGGTNSTLGSHGIEVGYNLLHNIQAIWRSGTTLNSPNTSFGNATGAPTTDLFDVAWSGASPDSGAITYRNLQTITPVYQPTERNASTVTIAPASTSQSVELYLGATGLIASTSGLSARYNRTRTASVSIPLVARTIAQAWTSGGFAEVDATNMPGVYRLDVPDAALAAGADDVTIVVRGASGTNGAVLTVTLSSGGLTAAQTADAVWGASVAGYTTATDFGGLVNQIDNTVTGIDAVVQDIPSNVWEELRANHTTAGSFGEYVNAELVTPVTSAALVRMGPFEVRADGLGASDPLDIQKGAQHGIDIQCVDNNGAGIDITSATVTAKVYNSGATLVDTYSCTATYAADGRAQFTIDTTVTNTPGTYTATITRTTGASDTQIFGPLRIYVRDI
jgi:hypothetical protein